MAWYRVCALQDLPVLGARVIERDAAQGGNVAVFRTATDRVFALRDRCPHRGGPLSQGIVYGEAVACPLHNWSIALASGSAMAPDEGHTACFGVRVDAGTVYVELDGDTGACAAQVGREMSPAPG
ncbi:MAG: nitrite reductase small subunit NirD [Pseudomonadota bacterium]|nr:nitrite reductase small subunit NirD [Pseudomonadota bacterium]